MDEHFSRLCDRIGYNTLTSTDIDFIKSRDIPVKNRGGGKYLKELLNKILQTSKCLPLHIYI